MNTVLVSYILLLCRRKRITPDFCMLNLYTYREWKSQWYTHDDHDMDDINMKIMNVQQYTRNAYAYSATCEQHYVGKQFRTWYSRHIINHTCKNQYLFSSYKFQMCIFFYNFCSTIHYPHVNILNGWLELNKIPYSRLYCKIIECSWKISVVNYYFLLFFCCWN